MLISHRYRFIFIKTRKTAGTSVEIALSRSLGPEDVITEISPEDEVLRRELGGRGPQNHHFPISKCRLVDWKWAFDHRRFPQFWNHAPAELVRRMEPALWDRYYTFTIERNPWDLVVSHYYWLTRNRQPRRPFQHFVSSPRLAQWSNWPLYTLDEKIAVDKVIRYESLTDELAELAEGFGLPEIPKLPNAKSGYRPATPYQELYDHSSRRRVEEIFSREIEYFGWTFDAPSFPDRRGVGKP